MLLEITPEAWKRHLDREKRKRKVHMPREVHIGGAKYYFDPQCEVEDNVARVVVSRRKYIQIATASFEPEPIHEFECTYCEKPCKSKSGLISHQKACKEK